MVNKLHPSLERLWQRPRHVCSMQASDIVWYCNNPIGVNLISSFMSRMSIDYGLSQEYTNQCISVTPISSLNIQHLQGMQTKDLSHHKTEDNHSSLTSTSQTGKLCTTFASKPYMRTRPVATISMEPPLAKKRSMGATNCMEPPPAKKQALTQSYYVTGESMSNFAHPSGSQGNVTIERVSLSNSSSHLLDGPLVLHQVTEISSTQPTVTASSNNWVAQAPSNQQGLVYMIAPSQTTQPSKRYSKTSSKLNTAMEIRACISQFYCTTVIDHAEACLYQSYMLWCFIMMLAHMAGHASLLAIHLTSIRAVCFGLRHTRGIYMLQK